MDILSNVQKAVKSTIKTLEDVSGTSSKQPWRPVKGVIYRNKITHFKQPIAAGSIKQRQLKRPDDWALRNFFETGEAVCRFCFKLASDLTCNDVFVIINDRIREMFVELTAKQLKSDGMPELLCPRCEQNLTNAVETRRKVIEAETKLIEFLQQKPAEDEEKDETENFVLEPEIQIKSEPMDDAYEPPSEPPDYAMDCNGDNDDFLHVKEGFSMTVEEDGAVIYACTVCSLNFESKDEQRVHFMTESVHRDEKIPKTFPCDECNTILSSQQSLKRHNLAVHGKNVGCEHCGLYLSCMVIDDHMQKEHPDESYVCDLCQENFDQILNLRQHILTTHQDKEKPFKCAHCDLWFEEKVYRRIHVNQKHKIQSDWGCLHCGLKCHTKQVLKVHLAECVKVIEEETGMKIKMETKVCEICEDTFMNRNDLANHKLRMHTSKYDCPLCASKFTIKKKFEAHVKRHKDVPRPYKCNQCEASYGKPAHLQSHVIRTHTKNFKYHCQYCLKGFIQVGEKVAHERTHTGEKPVACGMCDKRFARQEQLRRHIKRTHSKRKMFRCQWCQRDLSDSRKLFDHVNKFHPEEYNSDVDLDTWSYEIEPEIPDSLLEMPGRPLNYQKTVKDDASSDD